MKFLRDLKEKDVAGKTAVLRLDLNIEPDELVSRGRERHNWKIDNTKPTLDFLLKNNAKNIIILSHRGRPSGFDRKFSLKFLIPVLNKMISQKIIFWPNHKFNDLKKAMATKPGVYLVENLRFLSGEEKNDLKLAKQLAGLGDFYINDAFAVSHRTNVSVAAITRFIPSYAGLLLEKEVKNLRPVLRQPNKPLIVILGGSKAGDKIGLIDNFYRKADYFLLGGVMANTFLAAEGLPVGDSLIDEKAISFARKYRDDKKVILPVDLKINDKKILDIGPETLEYYAGFLRRAGTIIWNGPMGWVENPEFRNGTGGLWRIIAGLKNVKIIVGGGDTASFSGSLRNLPNIFVSTGGGAMLTYLSNQKMPGLDF